MHFAFNEISGVSPQLNKELHKILYEYKKARVVAITKVRLCNAYYR